jgi:hypothetical protein
MKTISLSLYNRSKYTKVLLDSLDNCFNIDQYAIYIRCEPDNQDVINLAKKFRPDQTQLHINDTRYGCNKNIYTCLNDNFLRSEYHIHLEDDTIPGKDFLLYCELCDSLFKEDDNIFSVSGYVNSNNIVMDKQFYPINTEYYSYGKRNWFTPWGWATWRNRWNYIKEVFIQSLSSKVSWDHYIHRILQNRVEVFPLVSRIQNVGAEQGTYCPGPEWHYNNQYNHYWIETNQQYLSKDSPIYETI